MVKIEVIAFLKIIMSLQAVQTNSRQGITAGLGPDWVPSLNNYQNFSKQGSFKLDKKPAAGLVAHPWTALSLSS